MLWLLPLLPMLLAPAVWLRAAAARRAWRGAAAVGIVGGTLALAVAAVAGDWRAAWTWGGPIVLRAALDPVAALLAITVPLVALPIVAYAAFHEAARGLPRLLTLLVFFVGAMELVVVAADLLTLLIGWELVGACSWALIAHEWQGTQAPRAARSAFLVTRLGDLGLFVAAAAAFAGAGSLDYASLPQLAPDALAVVAGGVVLAAGAKSAQLPFAPWLFAAMAGPTSVSALLHAATMVAAGAFLLARLEPALAPVPWFGPVVLGVGLSTALAGGLVAAFQAHAKKLLAASTSAHYGLMWVAVGAGYPAVAALHLVTHAFAKALLFLAAGAAGSGAGGFALRRMRLGAVLPLAAACSAVGALALAGVPPLGAFWTKEWVAAAAGHEAAALAVGVAVAGALSALYATRFQLLAFGRGGTRAVANPPSRVEQAALGLLAAVSLGLSLLGWPGARPAAADLLGLELPHAKAWELWTSLGLVALGLYAGRAAAARAPELGAAGTAARVADWLGLPALGRAGLEAPLHATARGLARLDVRGLDAVPEGAARLARSAAPRVAGADGLMVQAGLHVAGRLGEGVSRLAAWLGEAAFDGLAEGAARLADRAGSDVRRTQTGRVHHTYAGMAAVLLVLLAILAFGR